jgi:hypothetical protein
MHRVLLEIITVTGNAILVTSYLLLYKASILLNIISVYKHECFATKYIYIYLPVCTTFPHLPAPIEQL